MKIVCAVVASLLTMTFVAAGQSPKPEAPIIVRRIAIESAVAAPYPGTTNAFFTVEQDGLFRISYYLEVLPSSTGAVCAYIGWTDSIQAHLLGQPCANAPGGSSFGSSTFVVHAKAGTVVTYNYFLNNIDPPGTAIFNAFLVAERLGQ